MLFRHPLSKLLALFGGDKHFKNQSFTQAQLEEVETQLRALDLEKDPTLKFCKEMTKKFSFEEPLKNGLKRTAWHYLCPSLSKIEANFLGQELYQGLSSWIKNGDGTHKPLVVKELSPLKKQIEEIVNLFIKNNS